MKDASLQILPLANKFDSEKVLCNDQFLNLMFCLSVTQHESTLTDLSLTVQFMMKITNEECVLMSGFSEQLLFKN